MAESNPERASSSESEEEEGSVSDMPPPDQEPPKLHSGQHSNLQKHW